MDREAWRATVHGVPEDMTYWLNNKCLKTQEIDIGSWEHSSFKHKWRKTLWIWILLNLGPWHLDLDYAEIYVESICEWSVYSSK